MTANCEHRKNIDRQAHRHPLVEDHVFRTIEEYVLYLMHLKSYEAASKICCGKDVLDWGCNAGYGMEMLAKTAASVSGLDLSERAIIAARQRLGKTTSEIQCYKGANCGFADQTFDAVTSFQVLEHISDYDTYFNEIRRVLRPGGLAIFATPNALLRLAPGMEPWYEFHVREFSPHELRELLMNRFPSVVISGLFATDELYSIERDRVEGAKRAALARQNQSGFVKSIKRYVKKCFPFAIRLRDAVSHTSYALKKVLPPAELERFSTANLYYKDENIDDALDLLAVCKKS